MGYHIGPAIVDYLQAYLDILVMLDKDKMIKI